MCCLEDVIILLRSSTCIRKGTGKDNFERENCFVAWWIKDNLSTNEGGGFITFCIFLNDKASA